MIPSPRNQISFETKSRDSFKDLPLKRRSNSLVKRMLVSLDFAYALICPYPSFVKFKSSGSKVLAVSKKRFKNQPNNYDKKLFFKDMQKKEEGKKHTDLF